MTKRERERERVGGARRTQNSEREKEREAAPHSTAALPPAYPRAHTRTCVHLSVDPPQRCGASTAPPTRLPPSCTTSCSTGKTRTPRRCVCACVWRDGRTDCVGRTERRLDRRARAAPASFFLLFSPVFCFYPGLVCVWLARAQCQPVGRVGR